MRRVFAFVVALACLAPSTHAHVVVPAEFRDVVGDATVIVRGRVTDVRSLAVPGGAIDSVATVAVESVLKGQPGAFVYVRVPGGEIGRSRHVMVGAPTFRAGQRAVFFLKPGVTDTTLRPVGLTMGIYRVQSDPQTRRPVVEPPLIAGRTTSLFGPTTRGDVRRRLMPITEFEALVRLVVAAPPRAAVSRRGGQ